MIAEDETRITVLTTRAVRVLTEAFRVGVHIERRGIDTFVVSGALPSTLDWRLHAFRDEVLTVLDFFESAQPPPREYWS